MSKYPAFIEYNGRKYMNTKTAADNWKIKTDSVAKYCSDGKIPGVFKYYEKRWYIPTDAVKPLSDEEIRRFLVLSLQLKNKPSLEIDWSTFTVDASLIETIYRYLVFREMIESFETGDVKRIPYEVTLTQKGMEFATSRKKDKIEDFGTAMKEWLPTIIGAAQLLVQVAQAVVA